MKFFRSRAGAVTILIFAILFSVLFGSHRSLMAEAAKVTEQNEYVTKDLETRASVGHNFYAVAERYLSEDDPNLKALREALDAVDQDGMEPEAQAQLRTALDGLSGLSGTAEISEQDERYIRGFQSELRAVEDTLSRDPYNALAERFNEEILGEFPASLLGRLTGVDKLPIYH